MAAVRGITRVYFRNDRTYACDVVGRAGAGSTESRGCSGALPPGIFEICHTTSNESAIMSMGAHWHAAIVNTHIEFRGEYSTLFRSLPIYTFRDFARKLEDTGVKVLRFSPPICGETIAMRKLRLSGISRLSPEPDHDAIVAAAGMGIVHSLFKLMDEQAQKGLKRLWQIPLHPPLAWLEPAKPKSPFEEPERHFSPLKIEASMSSDMRERYNGFQAGREAAHTYR